MMNNKKSLLGGIATIIIFVSTSSFKPSIEIGNNCLRNYNWCTNLAEHFLITALAEGEENAATNYVNSVSECIDELDECIH